MNERIRELAEQAEMAANKGDHVDVKIMMAKLAELIVAECARVANLTEDYDTGDYKSGRHWASFDIKNHFGVEE
jgi:hypothetical protein